MKNNVTDLETLLKIKALKDKQAEEPIRYKLKGTDTAIEIKKPNEKDIYETINKVTKDDDTPVIELWDELIYMAIPELHSKEVLAEFGCENNPVGVVKEIFSYGDRVELGTRIKDLLTSTNLEEIKNS